MDIIPTDGGEPSRELKGRDTTSIPWFDNLISGSQLGNMHTTKSVQRSRDGSYWVKFEITEWTADDDKEGDEGGEGGEAGEGEANTSESSMSTTGKRKRTRVDDGNIGMSISSTA